ncbi:MAG: zinc-binding dehydrogenase [Firmicutes bacterium]|jgi:L-iditol 2-dehydrogenase|nr:zinc-binding dehydrogenase [Bacillota bacterium]
MKAVVYHGPMDLKVEEVDCPKLGPGDALLKVSACGVCGTDVKTYRRGHHMFTPPCILGHEAVGRIVEMRPALSESSGVNPDVGLGDEVAVAPYVPCYSCDLCRHGRQELCMNKDWIEGAFAEYIRVPSGVIRKGTFKLPNGIDRNEACLTEPLACCINAVTDAGVQLGDTVLVIGAGPMGLLILELCKSVGVARVLVSEPNAWRREEARRRGALVIDPSEADVKKWARESTAGDGPDVAFVCVGAVDAVDTGMEAVRQGGVVNVFGGLPGDAQLTVDAKRLHYDEITIMGSFGFAPHHFETALAMIAAGRINVKGIITHVFKIEGAKTAFNAAEAGETLKVVLQICEDA